jgi:hypothetical protein
MQYNQQQQDYFDNHEKYKVMISELSTMDIPIRSTEFQMLENKLLPYIHYDYKYQTKTFFELCGIYSALLKADKQQTIEFAILTNIIIKVKYMANIFHKIVNKQFIFKYLNNEGPIDMLSELDSHTKMDSPTASFSHRDWLTELRQTKLKWDRSNEVELKDKKLMLIQNQLQKLQQAVFELQLQSIV